MFIDDDRNKNLRTQILQNFVSSVMTDEERAKLFNLPKGCRMRENAKILSPENFTCGEYVWIGEGAILDASGGLSIGDHTSIGSNVMIWTHASFLANITYNNIMKSPLIQRKATKIGRGCHIPGHTVIFSGVTLGDRTVVLPMSVVNRDFPGNCIIGGSPARKIRDITDEFIQEEIMKLEVEDAKSI